MNPIQVTAAAGLRVPLENNPHEYIGTEPVEVDGDSLYYRRLLADGDLLPFAGRVPSKPKSKGND